jgi:hypothetical protein
VHADNRERSHVTSIDGRSPGNVITELMDEDRYLRIPVAPMDALPDVLAKVRSHGGRPVFLSIPASSPLFLTASEFRALRETVRSSNANLIVVSEDRQRQDFAKLFNLVPAENEDLAIAWIGDQASPRPQTKTAIDPALGPPRTSSGSGWTHRADSAPPDAPKDAPAPTAADPAPPATSALVPVLAPEPAQLEEIARKHRRWPWLVSLLVLLSLIAAASALLPQATVTLTRERTPITTDLQLAVIESGVDGTTLDAPITVAGQRQSATVTVTATLPATGQASVPDQPAKGGIAFANAGTEPITLPAGTQFVSDGGIAFTLDTEVLVPAATGNVSGNADGTVTAVEGGTAGNLGQGVLSGRHETGVFFSNRNGALSGGTDRAVTVVSEEDLQTATAQLESLLPQALADALAESSGTEVAVVPGSLEHAALALTPAIEIGSEVEEFTVSATTQVTGLTFDPVTVREELLTAAIAQVTVPAGQGIDVRDAEITWSATDDPSIANATVLVWQVVDLDDATVSDLPDRFARGTVDDARAEAERIDGVDAVSIELKPDWLPSAVRDRMPLVPQRIHVVEE